MNRGSSAHSVNKQSKSNYTNSVPCTYQTGKASFLPPSYLIISVKNRRISNGRARTVDLFKQSSQTADVEVNLAISFSAYLSRVGLYLSNFHNSYKEKL